MQNFQIGDKVESTNGAVGVVEFVCGYRTAPWALVRDDFNGSVQSFGLHTLRAAPALDAYGLPVEG